MTRLDPVRSSTHPSYITMAIPMLPDTRDALGPDASGCKNRSLFMSRFADPSLEEEPRKAWFARLDKMTPPAEVIRDFAWVPPGSEVVHARLMGRLMVNMAGGVMENAGLCLDRFGLPFIPGDAVKGCARRMALQALHDWVAGRGDRPLAEDICAPCCDGFTKPGEMLAEIAWVFGWVGQDWTLEKRKDGHWRSDFAWAAAGEWSPTEGEKGTGVKNATDLMKATAQILGGRLKVPVPDKLRERPWKALPDFAGSVSFLEAKPNADPGIELDVVTCHHPTYYKEEPVEPWLPRGVRQNSPEYRQWEQRHAKWRFDRANWESARDTEDPVPIVFPAVKAQRASGHFSFSLIPLRTVDVGPHVSIKLGRKWLAYGLEVFGIGAKGAAGHGWFDVSDKTSDETLQPNDPFAETRRLAEAAEQRRAEEERKKAAQEEADLDAALAPLRAIQPDESIIERLAAMRPDQIRGAVNKFDFDERHWPVAGEEATDVYRVSLYVFLTERDTAIYDEDRAKAKPGRGYCALRRLAARYGRTLPE